MRERANPRDGRRTDRLIGPRVRLAISSLFLALGMCSSTQAAAQSRPTSGDFSLFSGRTLGNGHTAVAAGAGWPSAWAQWTTAPSSRFNYGFRGAFLYGSPILGIGTGVGVEIAAPIRYHIYGDGHVDLAISVTPSGLLGSGALVGEKSAFSNDVGFGGRLDAGLVLGIQVSPAFTTLLGVNAAGSVYGVTEHTRDVSAAGSVSGRLGGELLVDDDTILFVVLDAGYGIAPANLFEGHELLRGSIGAAFLL